MPSMVGVHPGTSSDRQPMDLVAMNRAVIAGFERERLPGLVTRFTVNGATMAFLVATTLDLDAVDLILAQHSRVERAAPHRSAA